MTYVIRGTGSDLPARVVSNDDIEASAPGFDRERAGGSLDEWVMSRTGVSTRHRLPPGEGTTEMAVRAARRALADAGHTADDIDLVVLGTFTSDARLPSTVSTVARALGTGAKCIQLETACTGFVDSLLVATAMMTAARYRRALVIVVEAMSAVVDPEEFMYQTIFGDGAAAVVVEDEPGSVFGIEALRTHTDAEHCGWTSAPGGGTKHPITPEVLADRSQFLSLAYKEIYRFAVDKMVDATHEVLNAIDLTVDDVDWLIPHQTGANIVAEVVERLKFPPERVLSCLDHTGNVSGASVAIALDEARHRGQLLDGDRIVIPVVGGGMAWGAVSLRWRRPRAGLVERPRCG
jgi:3-oxoacyl-[acyl-carrier-protein] synthase-3